MWNVLKYSKTGERNRDSGLLCQDYIYYMEHDSIQAITLADGTGGDDFARMGAEHSCKILAQLMVEYFEDLYNMDNSLIQFHIITNVQTELYRLCEQYGVGLKNLHSTLLGVTIDHKRNLFIAAHLGDGSIGVRKNKKIMTMSYPENGVNKFQTYLTSEHKVGKKIKIVKGDIKDIKEFILVSDGWNEKTMDRNQFVQEELFIKADESTYIDDVSFIALRQEQGYNIM